MPVIGRVKPSIDGAGKTGHFEESMIRRHISFSQWLAGGFADGLPAAKAKGAAAIAAQDDLVPAGGARVDGVCPNGRL